MIGKDHVLNGMLIALLFSAGAWFGLQELSDVLPNALTPSFVATMSVFINMLPFVIFMKAKKDNSMKGVGIVTIILALIVVFVYFL